MAKEQSAKWQIRKHSTSRHGRAVFAIWPFAIWLFLPACGSVERRITITSTPDNARVFLNDTDVGYTPLEVDFTWFGTYEVRVSKPGYASIHENREISAPLHEQPGIDFIALMTPFKKSTRIDWHFDLAPAQQNEEELILRARELRLSAEED